jgi:hypothetical protein
VHHNLLAGRTKISLAALRPDGLMRTLPLDNLELGEAAAMHGESVADIGVWMRPEVLAHKLAARHRTRPIEAWNMGRWPTQLSRPGPHRLFVASNGAWRGYFTLCDDALYTAADPRAPFTLLFDARTWTPIDPLPVEPFRSFTYRVPAVSADAGVASPALHSRRS